MVKKEADITPGRISEKERWFEMEKKLVENMVEMQKVQTNLTEKFDKLTEQISALLGLFEMAARSFTKHPSIESAEKDKEFLEKIDKLLDQNKTIAKGLSIMEERIRERIHGEAQKIDETKKEDLSQASIPSLSINTSEVPTPSKTTNRPLPKF